MQGEEKLRVQLSKKRRGNPAAVSHDERSMLVYEKGCPEARKRHPGEGRHIIVHMVACPFPKSGIEKHLKRQFVTKSLPVPTVSDSSRRSFDVLCKRALGYQYIELIFGAIHDLAAHDLSAMR